MNARLPVTNDHKGDPLVHVRILVLAAVIAGTVPALAQPPASTPSPGQARGNDQASPAPRGDQPAQAPVARTPAPATPRREGQPVNIKIDFTITDQRGSAAAIKRTLTLMVADERTGSIRSQSNVFQVGDVPLNVDASPSVLNDGKIRLGFNLQYDWPAPLEGQAPGQDPNNPRVDRPLARGTVIKTALHDSVTLILESGKPMIAAQSADPIGDRQVTVEVKATVLR
jgi:hypothetical protein